MKRITLFFIALIIMSITTLSLAQQTTNYISKFSNSSGSLNNSLLYQNGSNIGIGTTNPLTKLQIGSKWTFQENANGKHLIGKNTYYNGTNDVRLTEGIASRITFGDNGNIALQTTDIDIAGSNITSWNTLMLEHNGNVGIGTPTPNHKLHIVGGDGNGTNSEWEYHPFSIWSGTSSSDYVLLMGVDKTKQCSYIQSINANVASSTLAINLKGGNVGIGTATTTINNTTYKLAVKGIIATDDVYIQNTSNWPDYVFDESYKKPTIRDVEAFINANKHLPEVPSAAEVEQNGLQLGEMNKVLLKKLEEQMLYIIEQQKQIDELQNQINELKSAIKASE